MLSIFNTEASVERNRELNMRRLLIVFVLFVIVFALYSCSEKNEEESQSSQKIETNATTNTILENMPSISSYTRHGDDTEVNGFYKWYAVRKPELVDISNEFNTVELHDLNNKGFTFIQTPVFLDNETIIFSIRISLPDDTDQRFDLYKYNIRTKEGSLICNDFMFYSTDHMIVKDAENFILQHNFEYLEIENNEVKLFKKYQSEALKAFPKTDVTNIQEKTGNVLLSYNQKAAYANEDFSNVVELPFKNISRVCWADEKNILVAHLDGENKTCTLSRYNIETTSVENMVLPQYNYFLDPERVSEDIIFFTFNGLDHGGGMDIGVLNQQVKGIYRFYIDNMCTMSKVRDNYLAGVISETIDYDSPMYAFIYNFTTNQMQIVERNARQYMSNVAVSPNGENIVYTIFENGTLHFYLRQRS